MSASFGRGTASEEREGKAWQHKEEHKKANTTSTAFPIGTHPLKRIDVTTRFNATWHLGG